MPPDLPLAPGESGYRLGPCHKTFRSVRISQEAGEFL
jgi:hypothetical protein